MSRIMSLMMESMRDRVGKIFRKCKKLLAISSGKPLPLMISCVLERFLLFVMRQSSEEVGKLCTTLQLSSILADCQQNNENGMSRNCHQIIRIGSIRL